MTGDPKKSRRRSTQRGAARVPAPWQFVESKVPGCYEAWVRQVGLPSEGYRPGVTGRPYDVVATEDACLASGCTTCTRCYRYTGGQAPNGGTWRIVHHAPIPVPPIDSPRTERSHPIMTATANRPRTVDETKDLIRKIIEEEITTRGFRGALGTSFQAIVEAVADRVAGTITLAPEGFACASQEANPSTQSADSWAAVSAPERLAWPPLTDHLELRSRLGVRIRIWSGPELTRVKFYAADDLRGRATCLRVAADWWDRAAQRGHPGPGLIQVDDATNAEHVTGWLEARIPHAWDDLATVLSIDPKILDGTR